MNATLTAELADQLLEEEAKLEWEAFQPAEGTIEWYDKFFAEEAAAGSAPRGHYHREMKAWIADYNKEREEFGDDDAWLSVLREQYMDGEEMTADFEQGLLEEKVGKSGHAIANVIAGSGR